MDLLDINRIKLKWHDSLEQVPSPYQLTASIYEMVTFQGSMTGYLKVKAGDGVLKLSLIDQHTRQAQIVEQKRLDIKNPSEQIIERTVLISAHGQPWVFAKSYFNQAAQNTFGDNLSNLGNKFLGELLKQAYPEVMRSNFEYAAVDNQIIRRCLFRLNNQAILFGLEEAFLPLLLRST